jgi:hypothetical protein
VPEVTPPAGPRLFLSHSTRDKGEIQRLRKALTDRGVPGWEDVIELRLGDSLDALRDAIQGADAFVLYLTPKSIGSEWVQREVAWALEAHRLDPSYRLLPILRGLDRPALKLLVGAAEVVSIVLGDEEAIETAVPAILQALGLAPQNATARPDPEPAPPMAELARTSTQVGRARPGLFLAPRSSSRGEEPDDGSDLLADH